MNKEYDIMEILRRIKWWLILSKGEFDFHTKERRKVSQLELWLRAFTITMVAFIVLAFMILLVFITKGIAFIFYSLVVIIAFVKYCIE